MEKSAAKNPSWLHSPESVPWTVRCRGRDISAPTLSLETKTTQCWNEEMQDRKRKSAKCRYFPFVHFTKGKVICLWWGARVICSFWRWVVTPPYLVGTPVLMKLAHSWMINLDISLSEGFRSLLASYIDGLPPGGCNLKRFLNIGFTNPIHG